jgi:pimeloyl-ACP methyl ester carboxylesterase
VEEAMTRPHVAGRKTSGPPRLSGGYREMAGRRLHVYEGGQRTVGMPVVILHGMVVSAESVLPTAARLVAAHHVLVPDMPGCGASPRPDRPMSVGELADLVRHVAHDLGRPVVVVANSFGCLVAVELAVRHPELVHALILLGPPFAPGRRGWLPLVGQYACTVMRDRSMLVSALRGLRRTGIRQALAHAAMGLGYPMASRLGRVSVPVVIARGRHDHVAPLEWCQHLADRAATRPVVLTGGHLLAHTRPEAVAGLVHDTLR